MYPLYIYFIYWILYMGSGGNHVKLQASIRLFLTKRTHVKLEHKRQVRLCIFLLIGIDLNIGSQMKHRSDLKWTHY